jgi:hypothetical protein
MDNAEDSKEMSAETKKEIADARAEIKAGRFYNMAEVKKKLGVSMIGIGFAENLGTI